eukprot:18479-Heterococcus_DN1.PRE.1
MPLPPLLVEPLLLPLQLRAAALNKLMRTAATRFRGPVYTDKLVNRTPTSQLHPYVLAGATDGTESIIRWASTPVWIKGPGSPGPPDGVMKRVVLPASAKERRPLDAAV